MRPRVDLELRGLGLDCSFLYRNVCPWVLRQIGCGRCRRCAQGVELVGAAGGQLSGSHRIASQHGAHSLGRQHLRDRRVEERHLQQPTAQQGLDLRLGDRCDVAKALHKRGNLWPADHPPVTHQGQPHTAEPLRHLGHLRGHCRGICRVAREDLDGDWRPHRGAQQANHDLPLPALPVAVVSERPQLVVLPFQVRGGHVIQVQPRPRLAQ